MNLWRPSERKVLTPTCEKCGGMRPEYVKENRRRLGFFGASAAALCGCCGCSNDCPHASRTCSTGTAAPTALTLEFSGVTPCCLEEVGQYTKINSIPSFCAAINDVVAPVFEWIGDEDFIRDEYSDASCATFDSQFTLEGGLRAQVHNRSSGVWRIALWVPIACSSCPPDFIDHHWVYFRGETNADICCETVVVNSILASGDCDTSLSTTGWNSNGTALAAGYGGTVTITPCCASP